MDVQEAYNIVFGLEAQEEDQIEAMIAINVAHKIAFECEDGKVTRIAKEGDM